jgi:hypothetical protein
VRHTAPALVVHVGSLLLWVLSGCVATLLASVIFFFGVVDGVLRHDTTLAGVAAMCLVLPAICMLLCFAGFVSRLNVLIEAHLQPVKPAKSAKSAEGMFDAWRSARHVRRTSCGTGAGRRHPSGSLEVPDMPRVCAWKKTAFTEEQVGTTPRQHGVDSDTGAPILAR